MRSQSSFLPSRRTLRQATRRIRRRPALVAGALAVGFLATAGISTAAPTSFADASGTTPSFALASYTPVIEPAVLAVADDPTGDAEDAVSGAEAAIAASTKVTADIEASGLDVGVADTTVDTTDLEGAMTQLERAAALPDGYVTGFAAAVTDESATIGTQVKDLRGKLDAAIALKAKQEAEEKARREAAAAAAAAAKAAEAARSSGGGGGGGGSSPSPAYATGGAVGGTSPADAQATARSMMAGYGWGESQFGCLVSLWNKESGWNYRAYNSSSGATGIPQALPGSKMASAGGDWQTNPATQIRWGLGYISGRYGTPCGAWDHSQSVGWY